MALDRTRLDTLIGNLESGSAALQSATEANTAAQTQAATCKAALDAATQANQSNVAALKSFVAGLDTDGNDPETTFSAGSAAPLPPEAPPAAQEPPAGPPPDAGTPANAAPGMTPIGSTAMAPPDAGAVTETLPPDAAPAV